MLCSDFGFYRSSHKFKTILCVRVRFAGKVQNLTLVVTSTSTITSTTTTTTTTLLVLLRIGPSSKLYTVMTHKNIRFWVTYQVSSNAGYESDYFVLFMYLN